MAEVEIGLGAIVEHVNFAVLKRIHRPGIDVQIGIELLQKDALAAELEQGAEGSRRRGLCLTNSPRRRLQKYISSRTCRGSLTEERRRRSTARASSGVSTPGEPLLVTTT